MKQRIVAIDLPLTIYKRSFKISDKIIVNEAWIDVENEHKYNAFQIDPVMEVVQNMDAEVYDEFCDYQDLSHDDIPEEAWGEVQVQMVRTLMKMKSSITKLTFYGDTFLI